jgi:hypothetical protein
MTRENSDLKYLLWSGLATLRCEGTNATLNCNVYQQSTGKGDLIIESEDVSGSLPPFIPAKDLQLDVPGVREPLDVIVTQNTWNSEGLNSLTLRPLRVPCWFSRSKALRSGRFAIVNFAPYWIGNPQNLNFELKALGWKAQFIAVTDKSLEVPQFKNDDDFRVTHQVEFSQEDGSPFTELEAQDFLWKLSLFLSFCRGHWVTYSLMVGLDENGEMALEQWGTGRVSTWREPSGWLDEYSGNCIGQLYDKFSTKLQQETWLDVIKSVVYWFTRADTNNVGPDGACILLQAALERLAWHIIVRERNAISAKGFQDLTAADQLRLMLNMLLIPTTIPNGLAKLQALGRSRTLDGPGVFTYIRNRLTHPPKVSTSNEQLPYYEAYCLAQWYVELVVLASCGYTGKYGNRTMMRRWVGQVEMVPWA